MRKQLELELNTQRKRVSLAPEAEQQGSEEAESGVTEWFPDTQEPPCSGYWEVRETFDHTGKIIRHFYDRSVGKWPEFLDCVAKFQWRGLKAPAAGGYPYDLHGPRVNRRAVLSS